MPAVGHPTDTATCLSPCLQTQEFYAERLEQMKKEKPGLRLMQYKSKIFDEWARSPLNPRNQAPSPS